MVKVGDSVLQGKDGLYGYATCTRCINSKRIDVVFSNTKGERHNCNVQSFKKGGLRDYFYETICNTGYLGEKFAYDLERDFTHEDYIRWYNIIRNVSKKKVTCSEEFKNFSKYVDWLHERENFKDLDEIYASRICIDKDIIEKGNMCYSFDKCCIVPNALNEIILFTNVKRGSYPLGVARHSDDRSVYVVFRKTILGENRQVINFNFNECNKALNSDRYSELALQFYEHYNIPYEEHQLAAVGMAFERYRKEKLKYIIDCANHFRNFECKGKTYHLIDQKCFDALNNWQISILD